MDNTEQRDQLEAKRGQLSQERTKSWDENWKTLRDNIDPDTGQFPDEEVNSGARRDQKILNNTATMSAGVLAAGMQSGMTSPARPWFELAAPDPEMNQYAPVKNWLWYVQNAMREVFIRSNLYNVLPSCYGEQGVFGTGVIAAIPDEKSLVRFYNFTIGSYYLATSSRQIVDTIYRDMKMTPRQMAQKFGRKNLSQTVRTMLDRNDECWITVYHTIEPNDAREPGRMDNKNMPYRSVYWEAGSPRNEILRSTGFKKFPIMAPRWKVKGESVYGKGPGSACIGEVLALQLAERRKWEMVDKGVRPPMTAPASMKADRVSILPGDVTWLPDSQVGVKFQPAYIVDPNWIGQLRGEISSAEQHIKTTFFEDLFLMISSMDDVRTATEIAARKEEKMLMLGPVLERQNDELLDLLIDITFQMMLDQSVPIWQGLKAGKPIIPPPPQELAQVDLAIEYVSILAQAQKALGVTAIERAVAFTGNLAASFPDAADNLNIDQTVTEYFEAIGIPPTMQNSADQVAAIRQARADAQAEQQRQAQLAQVVEGAKLLSETDMSGDNALTNIAQQVQ